MIFEYAATKTFNETLDIVDAGNTALRCKSNNDGEEYFIIIKTILGKTSIIEFGPVCQDIPMLLKGFTVTYSKTDYKETAIFKEVDKYINDFRKAIAEVSEITEIEAWEGFPEIKTLFENI